MPITPLARPECPFPRQWLPFPYAQIVRIPTPHRERDHAVPHCQSVAKIYEGALRRSRA
jgi:hypothetical protein